MQLYIALSFHSWLCSNSWPYIDIAWHLSVLHVSRCRPNWTFLSIDFKWWQTAHQLEIHRKLAISWPCARKHEAWCTVDWLFSCCVYFIQSNWLLRQVNQTLNYLLLGQSELFVLDFNTLVIQLINCCRSYLFISKMQSGHGKPQGVFGSCSTRNPERPNSTSITTMYWPLSACVCAGDNFGRPYKV